MLQTYHLEKKNSEKYFGIFFWDFRKIFKNIFFLFLTDPGAQGSLYASLPFEKKYQIQNPIKVTFAKSHLKFFGFRRFINGQFWATRGCHLTHRFIST